MSEGGGLNACEEALKYTYGIDCPPTGAWCNWQHAGLWIRSLQVRVLAPQPLFVFDSAHL